MIARKFISGIMCAVIACGAVCFFSCYKKKSLDEVQSINMKKYFETAMPTDGEKIYSYYDDAWDFFVYYNVYTTEKGAEYLAEIGQEKLSTKEEFEERFGKWKKYTSKVTEEYLPDFTTDYEWAFRKNRITGQSGLDFNDGLFVLYYAETQRLVVLATDS